MKQQIRWYSPSNKTYTSEFIACIYATGVSRGKYSSNEYSTILLSSLKEYLALIFFKQVFCNIIQKIYRNMSLKYYGF